MAFIRPVGAQYAVTRLFGEAGRHYAFHIDPGTGLWIKAQLCRACGYLGPCECRVPDVYGHHRGVDFGCPENSLVHAIAPGMILKVARDENQMHDDGLRIVQLINVPGHEGFTIDYRHLSTSIMREGSMVKTGDRIGYSGYDGPGGPYVHVEMRDTKGQFRKLEFDDERHRPIQT